MCGMLATCKNLIKCHLRNYYYYIFVFMASSHREEGGLETETARS